MASSSLASSPLATAPANRVAPAACGLVCAAAAILACSGCQILAPSPSKPSNLRKWRPELAVLPTAEISEDKVKVHNIRNCSYVTEDVFVVDHYDRTFELDSLKSVDFILVPFKSAPALAHTMLSFGFEAPEGRREYVAVSVEARLEEGEDYSPVKGAAKKFELMYVVADERDVIQLRTAQRQVDVYMYQVRAAPEQIRGLFLDVMQRANKLAREPEFYDTFSNNCTNNIVRHINKLRPGRVPWDPRILLPGLSDQLAYELGLLDTSRPFEELRRDALVNSRAEQVAGRPDFSEALRVVR